MSSHSDTDVNMAGNGQQQNQANSGDTQESGRNTVQANTQPAERLKLKGKTKTKDGAEEKDRVVGQFYNSMLRVVLAHYKIGQKDPRKPEVDPVHWVYIRPNKNPTRWFQYTMYAAITEEEIKKVEEVWASRGLEAGKIELQKVLNTKVREYLEMDLAGRAEAMGLAWNKWGKQKAVTKARGNLENRQHVHLHVKGVPKIQDIRLPYIPPPHKEQQAKTLANKALNKRMAAMPADSQPAAEANPPDQKIIDQEMEFDEDPLLANPYSPRQTKPYPVIDPQTLKDIIQAHKNLDHELKFKTEGRKRWFDEVFAAPIVCTCHPPEVTWNQAEWKAPEPAGEEGDEDEADELITSDPAAISTSATSAEEASSSFTSAGTSRSTSRSSLFSRRRKSDAGHSVDRDQQLNNVANLNSENVKLKQDLLHCQNGLVDAEKRNIDTNKEKENLSNENAKLKRDLCDIQTRLTEMNEQLAEWQRYHRTISEIAKFGDGIGKEDQDPTNSQGLQQQNSSRPEMSSTVWKRQSQEPGSDGDSIKRSRFDTQKNLEESGAKKASNVASRSFENML